MSESTLLIVGIVVFGLMLVAIVFTFLEFRQLTPRDSKQGESAAGVEHKPQ